jgi:hypothetical protein
VNLVIAVARQVVPKLFEIAATPDHSSDHRPLLRAGQKQRRELPPFAKQIWINPQLTRELLLRSQQP